MKKTAALISISLIMCIICAFGLTACDFFNFEIEGDGTYDISATGKADSIELLNGFFEETLKDPNVVVTNKSNNEVQFIENIKGTDSCYSTPDGSTKVYCHKIEGIYYYAYEYVDEEDSGSEISRYHVSSNRESDDYSTYAEEFYNQNYCFFLGDIKLMERISEDSGTFSASSHTEEHDSITNDVQITTSTSQLTFELVTENGEIRITAEAKDSLVQSISVVVSSPNYPESNRNISMSFEYGSAVVEYPDTEAWDREEKEKEERTERNEKAIEDRDDFFIDTFWAEYLTVTVTNNGNAHYVETIADEIDRVAYGDRTIYTYVKDVDEETSDFYFVYNGRDKYYKVNDYDDYNDYSMKYCLDIESYDYLAYGDATFSCIVEGNTMTFRIVRNNEIFATLVAVKNGDYVTSATYTVSVSYDGRIVNNYSFSYDEVHLTEPNLTGFEKIVVTHDDDDD